MSKYKVNGEGWVKPDSLFRVVNYIHAVSSTPFAGRVDEYKSLKGVLIRADDKVQQRYTDQQIELLQSGEMDLNPYVYEFAKMLKLPEGD